MGALDFGDNFTGYVEQLIREKWENGSRDPEMWKVLQRLLAEIEAEEATVGQAPAEKDYPGGAAALHGTNKKVPTGSSRKQVKRFAKG